MNENPTILVVMLIICAIGVSLIYIGLKGGKNDKK